MTKTMYYILTYDIANPKRLPKLLKLCRRYLYWIQNSVFEGELTEPKFLTLKEKINEIIKKEEDSVYFFEIRNRQVVERITIGVEKNDTSNFI
jgi:CRISPR-associated protein Cas2